MIDSYDVIFVKNILKISYFVKNASQIFRHLASLININKKYMLMHFFKTHWCRTVF